MSCCLLTNITNPSQYRPIDIHGRFYASGCKRYFLLFLDVFYPGITKKEPSKILVKVTLFQVCFQSPNSFLSDLPQSEILIFLRRQQFLSFFKLPSRLFTKPSLFQFMPAYLRAFLGQE